VVTASRAGAQVLAREDRHAQLAEIVVAAGVIAVDVGVDEKADARV
jgi:hypothetical protein